MTRANARARTRAQGDGHALDRHHAFHCTFQQADANAGRGIDTIGFGPRADHSQLPQLATSLNFAGTNATGRVYPHGQGAASDCSKAGHLPSFSDNAGTNAGR